jgi:PEP-CTERM motif
MQKIVSPLVMLSATTVACFAPLIASANNTFLAYDNADQIAYMPQPNNNWSAINGGAGYNLWTVLGGASGGSTYMEGVGVNGQQVQGNYSFGLSAGSGSYAISRPLTASIPIGQFHIITRFDNTGSGANLVNLRAGNDTSSFGAGELLSFGLLNSTQLGYTDSSGFHTLASGDSLGAVWDWTVDYNAGTGAFSLAVENLGGGFSTTVNGDLDAANTSVGSFGVIDSSPGNFIFGVPEFDPVPEPGSLGLLTLGLGGMLGMGAWAHRRK